MNELFDQIGSSSIFYIRVTKEILFPKQKIVLLPKRLIWWMFSVDLVMDESWLISSLREALPQKINSVLFEEERASKGELDLEIGLERAWQFQSSNTRIFEPRTCQTPTSTKPKLTLNFRNLEFFISNWTSNLRLNLYYTFNC